MDSTTTAVNLADITETANLLHGEEETVFTDAGYTGAEKPEELKDQDMACYIATKHSKIAALPDGQAKAMFKHVERHKAQACSQVKHVFHIIKDRFHYRKLRYKGL